MKKFIFVVLVLGLVAGGYVLVSRRATVPVVESSPVPSISAGIQGRWISLDDTKSVMIFRSGGVYEDVYDGAFISSGTWELDGDALTKRMDDDSLVYVVLELTEGSLVLSYTARGNTLRYVRVVKLE